MSVSGSVFFARAPLGVLLLSRADEYRRQQLKTGRAVWAKWVWLWHHDRAALSIDQLASIDRWRLGLAEGRETIAASWVAHQLDPLSAAAAVAAKIHAGTRPAASATGVLLCHQHAHPARRRAPTRPATDTPSAHRQPNPMRPPTHRPLHLLGGFGGKAMGDSEAAFALDRDDPAAKRAKARFDGMVGPTLLHPPFLLRVLNHQLSRAPARGTPCLGSCRSAAVPAPVVRPRPPPTANPTPCAHPPTGRCTC